MTRRPAQGRITTAGKAAKPRVPCDECKRWHLGPRCKPTDERTEKFSLTLPGRVARRLRARVGWGDRSGWVARLIEAELDRLDEAEDRAA